jgi:SAM-dependent MidA family methyltransferase
LEDLVKEDYENKKKGKEIPMTIFVMNEFFDALPVTILEYTKIGWREKVLKLTENLE